MERERALRAGAREDRLHEGAVGPSRPGVLASPWHHDVGVTDDFLHNTAAYCSDPDGDPLEFAVTSAPGYGSIDFVPTGPPGDLVHNVTHRNPERGTGRVEFAFSMTDGIADPQVLIGEVTWDPPYVYPTYYAPPPAAAPARSSPAPARQPRRAPR